MLGMNTPEELEQIVGDGIKTLRLNANMTREEVCRQAGISLNALKNLENGDGTTLNTLVKVLRVLKRTGWLDSLAPLPTINPLTLTARQNPRQRARAKKPR